MLEGAGLTSFTDDTELEMFENADRGIIHFLQTISFRIDESRAEAVAVSSRELWSSSDPLPPGSDVTETVDRPFFFFIHEVSTGVCLLSGRITDLIRSSSEAV